ncbi:MAG: permease-like cell division protein FtsX [Thiogranum sp.]
MILPRFLHSWITRHAQVALNSLGRLYRTPSASLLTSTVIAIALALPTGLYLLTGNLQRLSTQWDGDTNLSLFLHRSVSVEQAQALQKKLAQMPEIEELQLITPEQALAEFRELSGFGEALDVLDENPLPAVIAVKPDRAHANADAAALLLEELRTLPEVELAQLDLQWVRRFSAIVDIVRRSVRVIAALLGLAVLLIIGNTIRLEIQGRRDEIEVTKLIGGTNGFIRRPFLYSGLWYGLAGAILAGVLVEIAFLQLHEPVRQLAGLYQSDFSLHTLSFTDTLGLLATGAVLGLLGAWLAVGRHLADIEPT